MRFVFSACSPGRITGVRTGNRRSELPRRRPTRTSPDAWLMYFDNKKFVLQRSSRAHYSQDVVSVSAWAHSTYEPLVQLSIVILPRTFTACSDMTPTPVELLGVT
ncbi:hypothetical protein T10_4453 [Trichinella papuae]|uniref:Uncharacterized protein n=1 Tax=Trichinella papuae TaxID=268474 RepID=A0A0V1MAQ9_9BILA|nr:hypothetical protein T10_4453 [Trichinella papuae]